MHVRLPASQRRGVCTISSKPNYPVLDAAQRQPVVIRGQKRDVAVVLSVQEYGRLTASNVEEFQRFCDRIGEQAEARGLTDEKLAKMLASNL